MPAPKKKNVKKIKKRLKLNVKVNVVMMKRYLKYLAIVIVQRGEGLVEDVIIIKVPLVEQI